MTNNFAHLHLHTDYSMLDGLGKVQEYVDRAKALGMQHLGITDHGTISGAWEFYMACRKAEIEPVLGCEFYFVPEAEKVKAEKIGERFHVTMLARNEQGFKTLTELVTEAHKRFYYKPVLDRPLLESLGDAADNLVCLSGCAGSIISRKLMSKKKEERASAEDEMRWWLLIFNSYNYFTEMMAHGTDDEVKLNTRLLKLATKLDVPHVITNDPHYVHKEEHAHHDALLAIQTASDVDDPTRFRFDGDGYHLRSRQELRAAFDQYRKRVVRAGLDNSLRIAERCHTRIGPWENKTWHIPKFPKLPSKYNGDSYRYLRKLVYKSLHDRGLDQDERYVARTKRELKALKAANMADFLLITWEAINWAKKRDIAVGPGRGSICGCLVAYLLGIHKVDSIKYGLLFERFLNPERPKAPDVDTDFEPERRNEVIDHYAKLYGADNVVRVAAFQTMKVAGVFQTLARAHGISPEDRNRLTKELGKFDNNTSDEEEVDEEEQDISVLPEEIRDDYPDMAVQMRHLLGTKRAISRHAAGVVIFDPNDPIKDLVGLQWLPKKDAPGGGNWAAQFDLKSIEGMMLMKQDTLSLRTLATIKECVRMVKANHGVEIDVDSWVPDEEENDDEVYQMLGNGRTAGVFQMEGGSNTRGIQEIKPDKFEDIVTCTALYRAGPQQAGSDKRFLKNRTDGKVRTIHKSLKPILAPSMGEMIYDEQMLEIMFQAAGFSWAHVDDVKNAMKKKDPTMMDALKDDAIKGFVETSGMIKKQARRTWKMIEAQSSYLFNRCLTGDTLVYRSNYTHSSGQTISLENLYRIWHGGPILNPKEHSLRSAYRRRGITIKAYKDGAIKRAKVKDIHCNGIKRVWKLSLANGMSITSTGNHRHLATQGWRQCDELLVGDELVVDSGEYARPSIGNKHARSGIGKGWAARSDTERAIAADGRNRPSRGGHIAGLKAVTALLPDLCEKCGETEGRLERAHLDGDRTNNSRANVLLLCNHCHKQHDWDTGQRVRQYEHGYVAGTSAIVSIEHVGSAMTYDLEMDDPSHNFVANGIVTHNSHAVAYSLTTYITARLKYLYPLEFMTALVRTVKADKQHLKKRMGYVGELAEMGFKILSPDINQSDAKATCGYKKNGKGWFRFGFIDCSGIGDSKARKILAAREDSDSGVYGFYTAEEVKDSVDKGAYEVLARVGALESVGGPATSKRLKEQLIGYRFTDPMKKYRKKFEKKLIIPQEDRDYTRIYGELAHVEHRQTKNGKDFVIWTVHWSPTRAFRVNVWDTRNGINSIKRGSIVKVEGEWSADWRNISVNDSEDVVVIKEAA